jgi:CRISPR/Cas system-associated exonuclease Cas4 (RecB family)
MTKIADCELRIADCSLKPKSEIRNPTYLRFSVPGVLLGLACSLVLAEVGWACPGCQEALVEPAELPQRLALAKGYALSIGLLLAVPVMLVVGITARLMISGRVLAQTCRTRFLPQKVSDTS